MLKSTLAEGPAPILAENIELILDVRIQAVGLANRQRDRVIELCPGLSFYLTSDGFIEQVGGEKRRMFGKKRFKALLVSVDGLPFHEQKKQIAKVFRDYQGDEIRRDDVSVIGFKV